MINGIHHLGLTVRDVDASAAWYERVLGFERAGVYESPDGARRKVFLRHGGFGIRLGLTQHRACSSEVFDETRVGLDHLAFAVTEELDVWAARLSAAAVVHSPIAPASSIPGARVLVLRDPDNIQLELFFEPTDGRVGTTSTTRSSRQIRAPRSAVYRALLDAEAVEQWMVPDGMTSQVHTFDPRVGGEFRISLTYDEPTNTGKTSAQTDSFHGRFVTLVRDSEVVQVVEFESDDPAMQGEMTVTYVLLDADDGTNVIGVHENLPPGVSPADNELGWRLSLDKLARLLERQ